MPQLVGRHLEEMANMRSSRQRRIVLISSIIVGVFLSYYAFGHFLHHRYFFGFFNLSTLLIIVANVRYLLKHPTSNHSEMILSGVLLLQALVLLLYGEAIENRILWLFPIIASITFINQFKVGLLFSCSFFLIVLFSALSPGNLVLPSDYSIDTILFSLFAVLVICNTSSYYYAKAVNYIQSLYKEGIEGLAYMDQLTGLANRWSFENWAVDKLKAEPAKGSITALIFIDIDNFKSINDNYGHDVGDRVLQNFASRLKNNIRTKDRRTNKNDYSIARFAGDEFVILLYDVKSRNDLDGILDRICNIFSDKYKTEQRINSLTVSVGAAIYPSDAPNLSELTRCADKAMYTAKYRGKNQYCYYHDEPTEKSIEGHDQDNVTPLKQVKSLSP
ncbi:GGDEF domain-containing protein [Vibrio genomosp. F10]|uniref:Diguanylate cyclase n=2 Tax=Vibrio genomosp. F10 TaxID=723171 RepID=A0A1E5BHZ6_9VIBR|nr:GGDEF domain-containing protein [Vibrio genomosp. F10]OEE36855.1 diguanylate cyclase [Vibrio genomosp. F10 str. ZF-129]OEE97722.1 diguanylate cyclase [Vibrio genomosp. F10 str. 9ZC157]OEE98444.1 diguanylate cyclase [Vibrio genomosp. F10 str. 9ZD137]OEF06815.1 diguanylate cyclase [Vibrio genomosp. F10 str. 9ZB36]